MRQSLRSTVSTWLPLTRIANLPTVFSNLLAGSVLAAGPHPVPAGLWLCAACLYIGGMILNDVMDAAWDQQHQPQRPIPSGRISRPQAAWVGGVLMVTGLAAAIVVAAEGSGKITNQPLVWVALLLGFCVLAYNALHKRRGLSTVLSPILMGLCRGLVVLLGASALNDGSASVAVWIHASVITAYTALLTAFARSEHIQLERKKVVPWLIAGLCGVDAVALAVTGFWGSALIALGLGLTTRICQKYLRST